MKRLLMISVLVAMILGVVMPTAVAAASDSPCTDVYFACGQINGFDDIGCDLLFDVCVSVLYPVR